MQQLSAQESNLIVLQNADSLVGSRTPTGEDIRLLSGHVRFSQSNVRVWCNKAIQYLTRNEVELIGNVKVVRDTVTLTAKHGMYFGNTKQATCEENVRLETKHVVLYADYGTYFSEEKRAYFHKNVRVIDSATTIFSDELTYFEKERKSIAVSNVRIVNASDNITMFGQYLEHFDEKKYSKMTQHPFLMQIDTSSKGEIDTLAVKSLVMESFDDSSRKMLANDSVVIVRGELAARCGVVQYFTKDERIELQTNPVVWYEQNQITGDSISLFLRKNKLQTAAIRGRAFAISQSDSNFKNRYNQLTGRKIMMHFAENKLSEMIVERNAISLYFLYDGKKPNGMNKTSGDYISTHFKDGTLETIRVLKGIEGLYYPENLVVKNENKYNIDGFLLRNDRPTYHTVFGKAK